MREVAGCERARSRHVERAPCGSHLAHPVALLVLEHGKAGSVGRTEPQRLCADVGWLTGAHREKPFARVVQTLINFFDPRCSVKRS